MTGASGSGETIVLSWERAGASLCQETGKYHDTFWITGYFYQMCWQCPRTVADWACGLACPAAVAGWRLGRRQVRTQGIERHACRHQPSHSGLLAYNLPDEARGSPLSEMERVTPDSGMECRRWRDEREVGAGCHRAACAAEASRRGH